MKTSETSIPAGLERMNGLLAWWGIPDLAEASGMEAQAKRFQGLVVDLNRLFSEASSSQTQALSAANEQFASALQELLGARQPSDLMAAQSNLMTGLVESFAAQARNWAELTQKLHDCCSATVREAVAEAGAGASSFVPTGSQAVAERPATKSSGKRAA
jgi:hypothetical protein